MSGEKKEKLVTSQEKNRFLLASATVIIPTIIYNIAKSGKSAGDRIKDVLTASAIGLGIGVLVVILPRVIYGRKATTPLKDTKIVSRIRDQFSRGNKKKETGNETETVKMSETISAQETPAPIATEA